MATADQAHFTKPVSHPVGRWFYVGMALVFIATSLAGFLPAIVDPSTRRGPISLLAAVHGIVILAWQFLFLAQSLLVATRHVGWHRRLGVTSVVLLALIIPLSFATNTAMVRRGFDLSGDIAGHPPPHRSPRGCCRIDIYLRCSLYVQRAGCSGDPLSPSARDPQAAHAVCEHRAHALGYRALGGT